MTSSSRQADETWQAYNGWGGADLYGGNGPAPASVGGLGQGAAYAVSYNRPLTTLDSSGFASGPQDTVFGAEFAAIYWLEQNGYDVSYISGMDTATNGSLLLNHKIFMDAGHDEYWTDSQVANVQAAANAGRQPRLHEWQRDVLADAISSRASTAPQPLIARWSPTKTPIFTP